MGQAIVQNIRAQIECMPNVHCVTATHIILKSGEVIDPADFMVSTQPVVAIMKLLRCHCQPPHVLGTHLMVPSIYLTSALGVPTFEVGPKASEFCCTGQWTCEELLSIEQMRQHRLLFANGDVQCVPSLPQQRPYIALPGVRR